MIKIRLQGEEELMARMRSLADAIGPEKTTKILRNGADVVARKVKSLAPRGPTGNLRRSVFTRGMPVRFGWPAIAIAAMNPKIAPHQYWIEYGTEKRRHPKDMKAMVTPFGIFRSVGPIPAHPFFWPAWERTEDKARQTIMDKLKLAVEKSWNKVHGAIRGMI